MQSKSILMLPDKVNRHRLFGSVDPVLGNKPTTKERMADLQNKKDDYLFHIDHVGISRVRHPIQIHSETSPAIQTSIATLELTTSLQRESKGINMSRLTEHLESYRRKGLTADLSLLCHFAQELAEYMEENRAEITLSFPWFYERTAPVSGLTGLNHSDVSIKVAYEKGRPFTATVGLRVAVTTLCPCSKEISEYSAHNQRGVVSMSVVIDPGTSYQHDWKVILLDAAESNASSPLHPILKRPDEKKVTEGAYENPRFVEDMVRLVAADLYEMEDVQAFTVECRNEESIHLHDAVASITYDKRKTVH
ncbi:GTP cyclohydrolase FolE2 [Paenibacillus sp. ATY16]|uniref:GTP cyclohydrolase FolE2 n=1 Tax=Paenibacillus sp. ATY16 TaxID=1759312 RepID=UPI00200C7AA8|nr:GTP cyclohydrolase FolE2 [Paenibacillus sp. ATY16]MCK9859651.1 GTP cyclohydrolase FolE2 [Paenibacillus sp. ATY16]